MEISRWFQEQLQSSADGFIWAVEQVPKSRRNIRPPDGLGEWTAARHVFHMGYYEQNLALPIMRQWQGEAGLSIDPLEVEEEAWDTEPWDVKTLLARFKKVRQAQIALLPKFDPIAWNTAQETIWGPVTLLWAVSKTYQHTAEHTNNVLQIALFWDIITSRQ